MYPVSSSTNHLFWHFHLWVRYEKNTSD